MIVRNGEFLNRTEDEGKEKQVSVHDIQNRFNTHNDAVVLSKSSRLCVSC